MDYSDAVDRIVAIYSENPGIIPVDLIPWLKGADYPEDWNDEKIIGLAAVLDDETTVLTVSDGMPDKVLVGKDDLALICRVARDLVIFSTPLPEILEGEQVSRRDLIARLGPVANAAGVEL